MNTKRFCTRNSIYEVDENLRRIRRVSGETPCHRTFEPEGSWKPYESYNFYVNCLVVNWKNGTSTVTSVIV